MTANTTTIMIREANVEIPAPSNQMCIRDRRMSEAQWDAVIAVNLNSAFNFIHACTPIMMRQKSGSIINMACLLYTSRCV